jgi:soluble lytic murein transglycosylase
MKRLAPLRRRRLPRPARWRAVALLLACLLPPGLQAAPSAAPVGSDGDAALHAARAAAAAGDEARLAALAPRLAGHPLESYLEYWQASAALRAADDSWVAPFLERHAGSVLADRLRAEWLVRLAEQADWQGFEAQRRKLVFGGDEAQLACYTLLDRYALGGGARDEALVQEARRYLASVSDPGGRGCSALADRLMDDGALQAWPRLQALVERGQFDAAERTAARLGAEQAAQLKRLLLRPARWLDANAVRSAQAERPEHALAVLAVLALGRDMPEEAAVRAEALEASLGADERAVLWGRIGRSAQLKLLPQAYEWFQRAGDRVAASPDYPRAGEVLETRARADLRRGSVLPDPPAVADAPAAAASLADSGPDWKDLLRTIALMPAEMQADATWVYWRAQALLALGQVEEGRQALLGIAGRFTYYGRLAGEQMDFAPASWPAPPAPDAARVQELEQRPGFDRARRLFDLGMREEATREWNWELRGMEDESLHAAAELGRRLGVLDRMIASSERMRGVVDLDQRFPMPYPGLLTETSAPLGLDPAWVYGLIRQESRFIENIRSAAGAIGLMQIMPKTARYVAHRIGFGSYRGDRIGEIGVNLRLGSEYLKMVLDDQDGQPLLASAAYNAGPHRVRKWRAELARPLDGAIFAETIPINETREYVKHVLFNTVVYGALLQRPETSLRALLGPIAPKDAAADDLP